MGRQWQVGALRVVNLQVTEPQERLRFVFACCLDWSSSQGSSAEAWRNTTRAPANPKAQGSMGGLRWRPERRVVFPPLGSCSLWVWEGSISVCLDFPFGV